MSTTPQVTKKSDKPTLSDKEIDLIFRKLEPYLRVGLSLHAAALKADIPKSTVYDLYAENEEFVVSKQYSDQLSDNVKRGIRRSLEEGKYLHKGKHGYYKDNNQLLRPDSDNYSLLKIAWRQRLEGITLDEVAANLNKSHYSQAVDVGGHKHKPFKVTKNLLSKLFRDPFYSGVLLYGDEAVDLTSIYDFVPMIEVSDFLKINEHDKIAKVLKQRLRGRKGGSVKADLLRGLVNCGECDETMTTGITTKRLKGEVTNYFYYRCGNPNCKQFNKSVRAKIIMDFVVKFLEENKFTCKKIYDHYVKEMGKTIKEKEEELETQYRSLLHYKKSIETKIQQIKDLLLENKESDIREIFTKDLKAEEKKLIENAKAIKEIKEAKNTNKKAILTYSEFLELFDSLPVRFQKEKTMKGRDYMIRKIFSNFSVTGKNVKGYELTEPYRTFIAKGFVTHGRDAEIRTRGLTHPKGARYQAAPRPVTSSISAKNS